MKKYGMVIIRDNKWSLWLNADNLIPFLSKMRSNSKVIVFKIKKHWTESQMDYESYIFGRVFRIMYKRYGYEFNN